MYYSTTIFNQILAFVPKDRLQRFVGQQHADRYVKKMTVWNQFVVLMYAQASEKDSLRDIEIGLRTQENSWYHLGVNTVARSSIARANNRRDSKIFENLFYSILEQCRSITPKRRFSFENPLYSLDSTTVSLCLSLCNWARYRHEKGALKIHTLLNNRIGIPEVIDMTKGSVNDMKAARRMDINIPRGSILVFDRGYLDFRFWDHLHNQGIYFVTRPKKVTLFVVSGKHTEPHGSVEPSQAQATEGFQAYLKSQGYEVVALRLATGKEWSLAEEKLVARVRTNASAVARSLDALVIKQCRPIAVVSHADQVIASLDQLLVARGQEIPIVLMAFPEFLPESISQIQDRGLRVMDLEHDVRAFKAPLPRRRTLISEDDFDPQDVVYTSRP
ncbi:MAG: IS4 family transposase, partial [Patescibacteria group bacterium]|nr:IS4 family transposase [Patescibacteria group bacterium]